MQKLNAHQGVLVLSRRQTRPEHTVAVCVCVCATSADDSRDGWYAPPLKSGIQGELSGHTFLLSSVAQMFPRAVGHSHWEHRQLPHCSQCSVYEQLFIIHAAIHFGAHCVQQILCCCRSFSIMWMWNSSDRLSATCNISCSKRGSVTVRDTTCTIQGYTHCERCHLVYRAGQWYYSLTFNVIQ